LRAPIKHMAPEAKRRLAYHEAGHAVAIRLFQAHHRISRITIIRQGQAFGHVSHYPAQDINEIQLTKLMLRNYLKVAVAGRAGEIEFCGVAGQTLGVGGDFRSSRNILAQMALAGMLGPLGGAIGRPQDIAMTGHSGGAAPTPAMVAAMEQEFNAVLVETRQALREHAHVMDALVAILLEKDEMLADEVEAFFDQYSLFTPDPTLLPEGVIP